MRWILRHTLLTNTRSCRRAMVTISHIQGRNIGKQLSDTLICLCITHNPEMVTKTIGCDEVIISLILLHYALHNGVNLRIVGVGEEYRLDIRLLIADVNHTILLLVRAGELVLLDCAREVVLKVATHSNTILCATIHRLRIYIIVLLLILHQPATLLPQSEVLHSLLIDLIGVFVGNRIEVNLRLDDMQQRTLSCLLLCLRRVQHIVRA